MSLREMLLAVLLFIVVPSFIAVAGYRYLSKTTPEVRLVCKSVDKAVEMGRGHITYSEGLYRFTGADGIESTYDKSAFETCITLPIEAPR